MNRNQLHGLCLALCLSTGAPLALAAKDMNDNPPLPGQQQPGTGTLDQRGPSGSGVPGDGMGTGDGTVNPGNDDTRNGVGNPGTGRTAPDVGNPGGMRTTPDAGNPGTGRGTPATPGSSGGTGGGG